MTKPSNDLNVKRTTLTNLNADVLATILSFLDLESLARLEQTCRYVRNFIQQFGWTRLLNSELRALSEDQIRKGHYISAKEILRINLAWKTRTLLASQCDLDNASLGKTNEAGNATDSNSTFVPFCQLHLLPHGLILLMRCEMRYWPNIELEKRQPIKMENCSIFKLENPANLDKVWIAQNRRRKGRRAWNKNAIGATAVWDICASAVLNKQGTLVALARVNGLIEIVRIELRKGMQARVHLIWFWHDLMDSGIAIQTLTSCPDSGLLAICGKQGDVWLLSVRKTQTARQHKVTHEALNVRPLSYWKVNGRVWSACFAKIESSFRYPTWVAIGTGSREGILIYSLTSDLTKTPERIARLHCDGVSIYSIKTARVNCRESVRQVLYAGCFDGKLRTFDVIRAIETDDSSAMSMMYDKYDPSAMYCLLTGVGQDGTQIAAGTARHGVVKMFDVREAFKCIEEDKNNQEVEKEIVSNADQRDSGNIPDIERQGWSMFAAHPSQSPTYSLAGNFDRIFGVTDQKLWQVDLRNGASHIDQITWNDQLVKLNAAKEYELEKGKVAYYRHSDMLLEHSNLPLWITK